MKLSRSYTSALLWLSLCMSSLVALPAFAGVTQWYPFTLDDGHVLVDIELNGIPTKAILDTGAESNGISDAFIRAHNLSFTKAGRTRVKGVYGEDIRDRYNGVSVKLFGVDLTLNKLLNLNFGGPDRGLLLGAGFFDDFVTQIDYPNQRIRLINKDSIDMAKLRNVRAERDASSYMPIININLNNQKNAWLMLDTGMNGGILIERNIATNRDWLDGKYKIVHSDSSGVTRKQRIESFLLPSVTVGPFELENVVVSTPAEGQDITIADDVGEKTRTNSRIKGKRIDGLLGYDVLKHFVVTIDYDKGYVHFGLPEDLN